MFPGYHRSFDTFAAIYGYANRPVDNPQMDLAIGDAENLKFQPIMFELLPPGREPHFGLQDSIVDMSPKREGRQVKLKDVELSGWYGDEYGGGFS
ncbi:hypothetical protein [Paenibacillus sp. MER 99-2]|uniref:hypothetical protein n=1 Tax=Paenibacillus sp. MER 99-2 TaxID=2939572 RepID=UPI0020402349|nr:hypothetical protein [Paenibacillus sp. MER 99-2]MCM3176230.1 hypothetical protein [Paenibacillus sp. MER 99-2]